MKFKIHRDWLGTIFLSITALSALFYIFPRTNFWPITAALSAGIFWYIRGEKNNDNDQKQIIILSSVLLAIWVLKTLIFPAEFSGDEWTDIYDTYMKSYGNIAISPYNPRSGSSFPLLPETVYSILLPIMNGNIGLIRLFSVSVSLLAAYAIYLFAAELSEKKTAAMALFAYSSMLWAFMTSDTALSNVFLPALSAFALFFLLRYIKTNKLLFLAAFGAVFLAGFFTYMGWLAVYFMCVLKTKTGQLLALP